MQIVTIGSTKGGVGKTTAAIFLSVALADRGVKTLAIDLDPSNALTDYFLRDVAPDRIETQSVLKVLTGEATVEECLFPIELCLSIIGSTPSLMTFPEYLARDPAGILRLRTRLRKLIDYDVVIIDTPPSLGPLLTAGLLSADRVLTPVSPHRWILQARALMDHELAAVEEMAGAIPPSLALFCMVTKRDLEILRELGYPACETAILKSEVVRKAADMGRRLSSSSGASESFVALSREIYP